MRRSILISLCLMVSGVSLSAKVERGSIDPVGDSLFIASMRVRMDSVRTTQHRPAVGLVLSGGGAKGAAHAGVLKYLEELDIPIDVVAGTSMGGLIGGLYAVGHDAAEIDTLLNEADWNLIMSDDIPRKYVSFLERERRQEYAITLPFGRGAPQSHSYGNKNIFWKTLPSGYITGINVDNVFSSMTVGYQDSSDFRNLPIPFACIATDMVSHKAKLWHSGRIVDAMRSTMSIPFIFEPFRKDGMILIDGGTRNNFPSDIVRDMGVDIIIGVSLSDPDEVNEDIGNAAQMVMPFLDLLLMGYSSKNYEIPSILIKPDMNGFNMLSFSKENVKEIISRGYSAAKAHETELIAVKKCVGGHGRAISAPKARNFSKQSLRIGSVSFEGIPPSEAEYLSKKIRKFMGAEISGKSVENAKAYLFGTGAFHSVSYRMDGTAEPYNLVFECVPAPKNNVSLGVRADTKDIVNLKATFGFGVNRLSGSKLYLSTVIRDNFMAEARYMYDSQNLPTINIGVAFSNINTDVMDMDGYDHRVGFSSFQEQFYFSNIKRKWGDIKLGASMENYAMTKWLSNSSASGIVDMERNEWFNYLGVFFESRFNTMDRPIYPTKGLKATIKYKFIYASPGHSGFTPEHMGSMELMKVFHIGKRFAFIPSFHTRFIVADEDDFVHRNVVGGVLPGRYIPQQIPFLGVMESVVTRCHLSVMELKLRTEVMNNLFVSVGGGYMKEDASFLDAIYKMPKIFGVSLEAGYYSVVGPLRASVCWSNLTGRIGGFLSYGFDF